MAEDPKSGGAPKRLRPTVITPPVGRAKRPPPGPDTPPPTVRKPTAIPGVERRRIAVGAADILRLSPSAEPRTTARAVKLIDGFVVEGARDQHVVQWGRAAEQRATFLSDAPEPPHVDAPDVVRGYVGRIVELLGAIDLVAARDVERATRDELLHLIHRSRTTLDPLRALLAARDDHARQINEAGFEIEAAALAATFLAEHLAALRPELSRRFLQREMSLTRTALEIRSGQFERGLQLEDARALVAVIQDVVLAPLPDWLDGVAALARTRRRANPTQVGDLQHRLRALIRNLEPWDRFR